MKNAVDSIYEANIPGDSIPVKQVLGEDHDDYAPDLAGPFAVYCDGALVTDFIYDECGSCSSVLMAVSRDGTSVTSTVSGTVAVGTSVKVDIPDGTVAGSIRVIDDAVAGSDYDDTCISEIEIYGHNVG